MNFLLTNDDGITAPGLWAAAQALAVLGNVLVVAPDRDYSGYGAAMPPARELKFSPYRSMEEHIAGVTAFVLEGTPATCTQVGLSGALSDRSIDLVVSDINAGANLGRDVVYSGTVGAAITAHIIGYPAIAISLATSAEGPAYWQTAASCLAEIAREPVSTADPSPLLLNLNVPNSSLAQLTGAEVTSLSARSCADSYEIRVDEGERLSLVRRYVNNRDTDPAGSDAWALVQGRVSITPLRLFGDGMVVSPWPAAFGWATTMLEAVRSNGHNGRNGAEMESRLARAQSREQR